IDIQNRSLALDQIIGCRIAVPGVDLDVDMTAVTTVDGDPTALLFAKVPQVHAHLVLAPAHIEHFEHPGGAPNRPVGLSWTETSSDVTTAWWTQSNHDVHQGDVINRIGEKQQTIGSMIVGIIGR